MVVFSGFWASLAWVAVVDMAMMELDCRKVTTGVYTVEAARWLDGVKWVQEEYTNDEGECSIEARRRVPWVIFSLEGLGPRFDKKIRMGSR